MLGSGIQEKSLDYEVITLLEEKIIEILRENEAGMTVADLCKKHGMSSVTFYGWNCLCVGGCFQK